MWDISLSKPDTAILVENSWVSLGGLAEIGAMRRIEAACEILSLASLSRCFESKKAPSQIGD